MTNTLRPNDTITVTESEEKVSFKNLSEQIDSLVKFISNLELQINSINPIFKSVKLKALTEIKSIKKLIKKHFIDLVDDKIDLKTLAAEINSAQNILNNLKNNIDAITDEVVQAVFAQPNFESLATKTNDTEITEIKDKAFHNTLLNGKPHPNPAPEAVVNSLQEQLTAATPETPTAVPVETRQTNAEPQESNTNHPPLASNQFETPAPKLIETYEAPKPKALLLTTQIKIKNPLFSKTFTVEYKDADDLAVQESGLKAAYDKKAREHAEAHLKFTAESYAYVLTGLKAIDEAGKQPGIYDTVAATKKAIENYVNSGQPLEYHPFAPGNRENLYNVIEYLRAVSSVSDLPENMLTYKQDFAPFIYGSDSLFDKIIKAYDDFVNNPTVNTNEDSKDDKIPVFVADIEPTANLVPNPETETVESKTDKKPFLIGAAAFAATAFARLKAKFQKQPKLESTQKPAIENNKKPFFAGSTALATAALAGLSTTFKKLTSIFKKTEPTLTEEEKLLQETAKMEQDLIAGNSDRRKIGLGALLFSGASGFLALLGYNTFRTDKVPTSVSIAIPSSSPSAPTPPTTPSASATTSASSAPVEPPAPVPTPTTPKTTPPTKTPSLPSVNKAKSPNAQVPPIKNNKTSNRKNTAPKTKVAIPNSLSVEKKQAIIDQLETTRTKILKALEDLTTYYKTANIPEPNLAPINTCTPFGKSGGINTTERNPSFNLLREEIQRKIGEIKVELNKPEFNQEVKALLSTDLSDAIFRSKLEEYVKKYGEQEKNINDTKNLIQNLIQLLVYQSNVFKSEDIDMLIRDINSKLSVIKKRFTETANSVITITVENGSQTTTLTFQYEEQIKQFLIEYDELKSEIELKSGSEKLKNLYQKLVNLHTKMQNFYNNLVRLELKKRKQAGEQNPEKEAQKACLEEHKIQFETSKK